MYHYVRPLRGSRYPGIKGLELEHFEGQLAYIDRHYTPVTMEAVVASLRGETELPANAALLTFDDGYRDHYDHVLPRLAKRRWQGCFFVPASPVLASVMLAVNKLHFVLAVAPSAGGLVHETERLMDSARGELELPSSAELRAKLYSPTRFDSADVAYLKRLLQRVLPEGFRSSVLSTLFAQFVTEDERGFAEELYLSVDDLSEMLSAGMHVGGHGDRHRWLGSLSPAEQREELTASVGFLRSIGAAGEAFSFCYPYGDYNTVTLDLLAELGCSVAFTTRVDLATMGAVPRLGVPRLDTNDLPTTAGAAANEWARKALVV